MPRKHSSLTILASLLSLCLVAVVFADTLKLKDGSTLDNVKVIPQGEKYWVKLADGSSRMVAKTEVVTWTKGNTSAAPAPALPAPAGANKSSVSATPNSAT